jgi:hypothetical protein
MVHQDPFEFPQHFDSHFAGYLPLQIPGAILVEGSERAPVDCRMMIARKSGQTGGSRL